MLHSLRIAVFLLVCSELAVSVCLNGHPSIQQEYKTARIILVGKVVGHHEVPSSNWFDDGDVYEVVPARVFKGTNQQKLRLFSENNSGRFPMDINQQYLLFVSKVHGRLMVDSCGNSGDITKAREAAAEVTKLAGNSK